MILVTGPLIAQLCHRTRKWAHEAISNGRFGPSIERQGVLYVDLDRVADSLGRTFADEQITAAMEGRPDRIITINMEDNDAGAGSIDAIAG